MAFQKNARVMVRVTDNFTRGSHKMIPGTVTHRIVDSNEYRVVTDCGRDLIVNANMMECWHKHTQTAIKAKIESEGYNTDRMIIVSC